MRKRLVVLIALVLGAACAGPEVVPTRRPRTPAPSPTASPIPSPTPPPTRLTICLPAEPDSLYLYGAKRPAAWHVWQALYDGPVDSRDYGVQPVILTNTPTLGDGARVTTDTVEAGDRVLAASGSVMTLAPGVIVRDAAGNRITFRGHPIPMERMVVTYTLRADLRWADGERLTADDSVYAFQLAADPATPTDKHIVERTAGYGAVGDRQVVWRGVPGFLDRAYSLNLWHPLPRHAWEGLTASELLTASVSTREPLGWGPFALREWVPGEAIVLERNPFYFRAGEGLPRIDELIFRFLGETEDPTQLLLAGACDVVTHESISPDDRDDANEAPGLRAYTTQDSSWELLAFGISPGPDYVRPDYFEDVRVRRAIAHCLDRQALADEAYATDGRVLHSYVPPEHPAYAGVDPAEGLVVWAYEPEAGQSLLAEAGWYDADGDGVREAHGIPGMVDGTPFEVTYKTTDETLRRRTATLVEAQLEACGIDVTVETQPAQALFAPGWEGDLFGRRFDLAQFSWRFTVDSLCDAFLSSQMPGTRGWSRPNVSGFIDDGYDEACRSALETLPGAPDYVRRQAPPQRIFSQRLPVLPLFQRQKTTLARAAVTGLSPNASQPSELWNVEQLDVTP